MNLGYHAKHFIIDDRQFGDVDDGDLRQKVTENLRICYLRQKQGTKWQDDMNLGYHAKHFIIDDLAFYVGSQNLYVADLAEWGVLIDDGQQTQRSMEAYWNPIWRDSFTEDDCDVDDVMNGLGIDRNGDRSWFHDRETKKLMAP